MLLTESEAVKKLCPHTESGCIVKSCMAWRWSTAPGPPWKGYCGLAGKPEDEEEA